MGCEEEGESERSREKRARGQKKNQTFSWHAAIVKSTKFIQKTAEVVSETVTKTRMRESRGEEAGRADEGS